MQINKGLNGFQIKIIALFLMLLDHIHYIFSGVLEIPMSFTFLGRLSAPLFIFMVANGMYYTKNPKKYLLRLWLGFIFMGIGNNFINKFFPLQNGGIIINNIFSTLFLICFIIYCIQKIQQNKNNKKIITKYIFLMIYPIVVSCILFILLMLDGKLYLTIFKIIFIFVPNILFTEGGFLFVILGVGFYLCNFNKKKLSIFYILFCLIILFTGYTKENPLESMFIWNIQWFMIFSLPIILLYNREKGANMKYLFYIFYPAHIYILTIICYFMAK